MRFIRSKSSVESSVKSSVNVFRSSVLNRVNPKQSDPGLNCLHSN